jgi:AmiR/NasT family two-component response regulator
MSQSKQDATRLSFSATDFLLASKQSEMQSLQYFLKMGELVGVICDLVHAIQKERGASNLYLGSKGQLFASELFQYSENANTLIQKLDETLQQLYQEMIEHGSNSRLLNKIAFALHAIQHLHDLRAQIQTLAIAPDKAVSAFSELVSDLLNIIFEAADSAVEPHIVRALLALFNLTHGKELLGQERALGAAGFASGEFTLAQRERMSFLHDSQERCFELFADFSDPHSLKLWQNYTHASYIIDIERLRRFALNQPLKNEANLGDLWFKSLTEYMDDLKVVETGLLASLQNLCIQRIEEARQAMNTHQDLIATLDTHPDETLIVLRSHASVSHPAASTSQEFFHDEGIGSKLGRSVFELVQHQAHDLQNMQDELAKARVVIDNKKLQEKAKLLLMKHQDLTEDQAYKLLREMAMNQRKNMTEIAQSIVDMAQIWQAKP